MKKTLGMYPLNFSKFWILPSRSQSLSSLGCCSCCWPAARCCPCRCSTRCCHCTQSRCHGARPGCVTWCGSRDSHDRGRDTQRDTGGAEHRHRRGAGSGPDTGGSLCYAGRYSWGSRSSGQLSWEEREHGHDVHLTHCDILPWHGLWSWRQVVEVSGGRSVAVCACQWMSVPAPRPLPGPGPRPDVNQRPGDRRGQRGAVGGARAGYHRRDWGPPTGGGGGG